MTLIYKTILLLKTLCWNAQIRTGDTTSKELCVTTTPRSIVKEKWLLRFPTFCHTEPLKPNLSVSQRNEPKINFYK